jgi:hypothetical protein
MVREPASVPAALRPAPRPTVPRLALRPAEAAEALSISEKFLRGIPDLPRVRIGTAVLYPVDSLQRWLRDHEERADEQSVDSACPGFSV